jgi:hypothetical protein
MQQNDTINIVVSDTAQSTASFAGYMILGAKVENALTGLSASNAPGSPLKKNNDPSSATVCVVPFPPVAPSNPNQGVPTLFTFAPASNTLLAGGAWELTFVVDCGTTQFELDPEFDVSNP